MSCCGSLVNQQASGFGGIAYLNTSYDNHFDRWKHATRLKSTVASAYHESEESDKNHGLEQNHSVAIEDNGMSITITVDDHDDASIASSSSWNFSSALLWVNDPRHIHASSGQRTKTLGQYSNGLKVVDAHLCSTWSLQDLHAIPPKGSMHSRGGIYSDTYRSSSSQSRNLLELKWSDGQESIFDLEWLLDHAHNNCMGRPKPNTVTHNSKETTTEPAITTRSTTQITKDIAIGSCTNPNAASLAKFDYSEILDNEDVLFAGMQQIFEHGAILIQNAPTNIAETETNDGTSSLESIVGNLGKRFSGGALSHGSLYGDIFHVQSKMNAENIAYTNEALPPHQDLTYYESKPFLQLLHCVTDSNNDDDSSTNGIVGGESILIDAMAAAEELRTISPRLFDILCKTEATFVKERHDSDMVSPKPHIVLDPAFGQVIEVNWSPPFEGPLQMHPTIPVEDYVQAYQALECMLDDKLHESRDGATLLPSYLERLLRDYAKEYTLEYKMQRGDVIVFNNQRMLHGRRSFECYGKIERHLIGCYTDAMDTVSRYRQLLRQRTEKNGGGYGKRNPGSGYRWM